MQEYQARQTGATFPTKYREKDEAQGDVIGGIITPTATRENSMLEQTIFMTEEEKSGKYV